MLVEKLLHSTQKIKIYTAQNWTNFDPKGTQFPTFDDQAP